MKFCINDLLFSLSLAMDFAEKDIINTSRNHNIRVALISGKIGRKMGLKDKEIFDLVSYALLHDVGIVKLTGEKYAGNFDGVEAHCTYGEEIVNNFPFIKKRSNIILYHHETYDGKGYFGKSKAEIPLFSKIIAFSDHFDGLYRRNLSQEDIVREITKQSNKRISARIVNAWLEIQKTTNFWLDIEDTFVETSCFREIPKIYIDMDYKEIRKTTQIFSKIVDSYSPSTGNHTSGISEKVEIMCDYYQFDTEKKYKLIIAADLHDLGKLGMPNSILNKTDKLTPVEYSIIKQHTYFTRRMLEKIEHFDDITEWASNHHEKLNGNGYPYGLDASQLDFCSRLLTVIDIYQALTEERAYRSGMDHDAAMNILWDMVRKNEVDGSIVNDIEIVFGEKQSQNNRAEEAVVLMS